MSFGNYLRQLREKRNISINELAHCTGISGSQISRIETGKRGVPKPDTLKKLAPCLKVPYEDLMLAAGHLKLSDDMDDWIKEIVSAPLHKKEAMREIWNVIKGL